MRILLRSAWLLAVVLTASVLTGAVTADESIVNVHAGATHPTNPNAPYDYLRFYPSTVKVHRGQTIRWTTIASGGGGFHTITFSKAGKPAFFRSDEVPGSFARPQNSVVGSDCGRNGLKPCVLKSTTRFLSSGIPPWGNSPFDVKIDLPVGKYQYFCTNHPTMNGTVQVVGSSTRLESAKQIAAERKAAVKADSAAADAVFKRDQKPVSVLGANGRRTWQVLLGDSTRDHHVYINAFLPASLDIDAGDKLRYVFRSHLSNELHTVSFPGEASGSRTPAPHGRGGTGGQFGCDFDDPSSGARGIIGPPWGVVLPCPANLEVVWAPWMTSPTRARNDEVLTKATLHDSAFLAPTKAPRGFRVLPDGRTLPASFEATFPTAGGYTYECNLHLDAMTGSVNVS